MIGVISEWNAARNSGLVRPVDEPDHDGLYIHGAVFGNKPQPIGTRIIYTAWTSRSGIDMAVNARLATAEVEEVDRCLS